MLVFSIVRLLKQLNHQLNWDDRQQVNNKPRAQVLKEDGAPLIFNTILLILECSVKIDDYISDKEQIDRDVQLNEKVVILN